MASHHWDDVLAYYTTKIVRIRDRRLGITHLVFSCCIALYVVGFQILYANGHFERKDVYGTARMTIQQPTKNACNPNKRQCKSDFHALTELPYCSVYAGSSDEVAPKNRHPCIFADQHTLAPTGMLEGNMLVPTRIDDMHEKRGCMPSAANGYTCDNQYELDSDHEVTYVADVERYTIMLSHTYRRRNIEGNNVNIQGYLMECEDDSNEYRMLSSAKKKTEDALLGKRSCNGEWVRKKIECITGTCPFLGKSKKTNSFLQKIEAAVDDVPVAPDHSDGRRHRPGARRADVHTSFVMQEDEVNPAELSAGGFFSIPQGDIFRIDKLLQLSGMSLDHSFNSEGLPLRESGTVILIEVIYNNLHPFLSSFGMMDIEYHYKVSRRPMDEMKTELLAPGQPDYPNTRIIEDRHGLFLVVKIGGEFGFFSIVSLLVMLTTAIALLSVAGVITDMLALNVMSEKETYNGHKYETTHRLLDGETLEELKAEDKIAD